MQAHRTLAAVSGLVVLHLLATVLVGTFVPLRGFVGPQPTPTVCVVALLTAPISIWWLIPRTRLEQVSTRPLAVVGQASVWLATVAPAVLVALLRADGDQYLRAMLATTGMTLLVWRLTRSALSALPASSWFVSTVLLARLAPGADYWGWYAVEGDNRTWIIPVTLALVAVLPWGHRAARR